MFQVVQNGEVMDGLNIKKLNKETMGSELQNLSDFEFNEKLRIIWDNNKCGIEISPVYQAQVRKNTVTFLSLNPSLLPSEKGKASLGNNIHPPFPMIDCMKESPNPFYNKFYEINKKIINEQWTVIDLLYIRDSNQKKIEEIYNTENGKYFINAQVQLTLDIIKKIQPKLVIVSNRFVETILLEFEEFKANAKVDNDNIYRYEGIPFIMRESGFIGSRYWQTEKYNNKREKMYGEINRVITQLSK